MVIGLEEFWKALIKMNKIIITLFFICVANPATAADYRTPESITPRTPSHNRRSMVNTKTFLKAIRIKPEYDERSYLKELDFVATIEHPEIGNAIRRFGIFYITGLQKQGIEDPAGEEACASACSHSDYDPIDESWEIVGKDEEKKIPDLEVLRRTPNTGIAGRESQMIDDYWERAQEIAEAKRDKQRELYKQIFLRDIERSETQ